VRLEVLVGLHRGPRLRGESGCMSNCLPCVSGQTKISLDFRWMSFPGSKPSLPKHSLRAEFSPLTVFRLEGQASRRWCRRWQTVVCPSASFIVID